jgi:predicted RNA binding protein YcfA (HicA-like mRNA interferase family)
MPAELSSGQDGYSIASGGSHMILTRTGKSVNLSIPDHRELDRGLLRGLIRDSGMSVEDFRALL